MNVVFTFTAQIMKDNRPDPSNIEEYLLWAQIYRDMVEYYQYLDGFDEEEFNRLTED